MYIRCILAILAAMAISGDRADVNRYRTPVLPDAPDIRSLPSNVRSIDVFDPGVFVSVEQQANNKQNPLQPQSRLEIIRFVSGEFAKTVSPIPGGRKGFRIPVGEKLNQAELRSALRHEGAAVNVGETVQVTSVEFRAKEIVVQVNGGGKKHFNLREHLQVGVGGSQVPGTGQSGPQEKPGATLILDYGRPVPDLSADDVMTALQMFLSFSKEQSAAVNWVDTLPPQFKDAIKDQKAVVGMDHEMVLAALGRPDHKVRERDPGGSETEDWIYGNPPARTVFVTFNGDKVVRVKEYD
jgi:sulfur carrier protein ThiS